MSSLLSPSRRPGSFATSRVALLAVLAALLSSCSSLPDEPSSSEAVQAGPGELIVTAPDGARGFSARIGDLVIAAPEGCDGCGIVLSRGEGDRKVELTYELDGERHVEEFSLAARPDPSLAPTVTVVRQTSGGELTVETRDVGDEDPAAMVERLRADDGVVAAQVDLEVEGARGGASGAVLAQAAASSPEGSWHLQALDRSLLPSAGSLPVAVLDTGVDDELAVLDGVVEEGRNVTQPGTGHAFPAFHGTAMAALVHQMAPGAPIVPYDLYGSDGLASTADLVSGLITAVDAGHRIILVSQTARCRGDGSERACPPLDGLEVAIEHATSRGAVIIAAAGNNGGSCGANGTVWPAAFPEVIAVGASNADGGTWDCSNSSQTPDLLAPGEDVLVTSVGGATVVDSGTSISAALVAGIVSAVWSARSDLTADDIRQRLRRDGEVLALEALLDGLGPPPPDRLSFGLSTGYPGAVVGREIDEVHLFPYGRYMWVERVPETGAYVGEGQLPVGRSGYACPGISHLVQYLLPYELHLTAFPRGTATITFGEPYVHHIPRCDSPPGVDPDTYDPQQFGHDDVAAHFLQLSPVVAEVDFEGFGTSGWYDRSGMRWVLHHLDEEGRARFDELRKDSPNPG